MTLSNLLLRILKASIILSGLYQPVVFGAELIEFQAGTPAKASEVNQNFQAIDTEVQDNAAAIEALSQSQGGCSAAQDGSNVVITCADGTSGVLASEGTVVILPEGYEAGVLDIDYSTFPTGAFIVVDGNDVQLGQLQSETNGNYRVIMPLPYGGQQVTFSNDHDTQTVSLGIFALGAGYTLPGCEGQPFSMGANVVTDLDGVLLVLPSEPESFPQIIRSYVETQGPEELVPFCVENEQYLNSVTPVVPYTPPPEFTNAAYPISVIQLPE